MIRVVHKRYSKQNVLPLENPGGRVAGMEDREGNCLAKAVAFSPLRVKCLEVKAG